MSLTYVGTAKSTTVPETFNGEKAVEVRASTCGLTSLNAGKATYLRTLDCSNNKLSKLNVTMNAQLEELGCSGNRLKNLDVSMNKKLRYLGCGHNQLTKLGISKNKKLTSLHCYQNKFTAKAKAKLVKWGKSSKHRLSI